MYRPNEPPGGTDATNAFGNTNSLALDENGTACTTPSHGNLQARQPPWAEDGKGTCWIGPFEVMAEVAPSRLTESE